MRTRLADWLRRFFLPPSGAPLWVRLLPFAVLGVLTLVVLVSGAYAWDYTNSPEFCGEVCHTMPPEFTAYLTSPHARVDCVECHIGRGFIAERITRKAGDAQHIISLAFRDYEFPIRAEKLRPARETCERCHFPEKFSDDSLQEIKQFASDIDNTPSSLYLTMKTGGGSSRQGLGRGIHWHIENPVLFLPLDHTEQVIPYVRVIGQDGTVTEYIDVETDVSADSINPDALEEMDCITCHNRITHLVLPPDDTVDQLLARGEIATTIPEIRRKAVEVYGNVYDTTQMGLNGIAGLDGYYREVYPEFYAENQELIEEAIEALQDAYGKSVYPEQKSDWTTHPNNVGHQDSPGCFRCHDGKHLNAAGEAIRLECNLCHSIPAVAGPDDFIAEIEISRGPEPESHRNANWISLHRDVFDETCASCHTTGDPGGTSDTSFCSNIACHGSVFEYAGFDAPALREVLQSQLPPTPTPGPTPEPSPVGPPTYAASIQPMLMQRCASCHGENGLGGLNLTTHEGLVEGGASGPAVSPGNPEGSLLVQKQTGEQPHFGQLTPGELELLMAWIAEGAPQ